MTIVVTVSLSTAQVDAVRDHQRQIHAEMAADGAPEPMAPLEDWIRELVVDGLGDLGADPDQIDVRMTPAV